jgi:agmatine deiminase
MKKHLTRLILPLLFLAFNSSVSGQDTGADLPKGFAPGEKEKMEEYLNLPYMKSSSSFTVPPQGTFLRNTGEWEEVQALVITYTTFQSVHRDIIKAVQNETPVIIICSDSVATKNNLISSGVSLHNLAFIVAPFESVWIRDYMANTVYTADVDSLVLVDWVYNRPRPRDDTIPKAVANFLGLPLYETKTTPNRLVNTGGNFMSDGLGTAFASRLVLDENTNLNNSQVNTIMKSFMGIDEYIKMETLPYDGIHHIDMHMKLLDEETLLVGQYPNGVSDGPQIEANIQYVLNNFKTYYGRDFKVLRVPMPKASGSSPYPPQSYYYTYANSSMVNKTILVPIYSTSSSTYFAPQDSAALKIYREALPGYNVVGIRSSSTIPSSGSIHCITHTVGVDGPLFISHKAIRDTMPENETFPLEAMVKHRSGIQQVELHYRISPSQQFQVIAMAGNGAIYTAEIPAQAKGITVEYFIEARANSGKTIAKPMTAPSGYYSFYVNGIELAGETIADVSLKPAFPNPSKGITCIPVYAANEISGSIILTDLAGRQVKQIFSGVFPKGESKYFVDASEIPAGAYLIVLQQGDARRVQKWMVR